MLQKFIGKLHLNDYGSTAVVLVLATLILVFSQALSRLDYVVYDLGQKLRLNSAPKDIIIVAIDEISLSQIGRWPWPREVHARLIDQLKSAGARVIALDIILSEQDKKNILEDDLLSASIRQAENVVLPVLIETTRTNGQLIETLPLTKFATHAADLGRVHAVLDEDGIVRSFYLFEGIGAPAWQHFSQAILNVANKQPSKNGVVDFDQTRLLTLVQQQQRKINFLAPNDHFDTISYSQVLKGEYPQGLFQDKIVFVGATASGMNDLLSTPVSSFGQPMPGVEVHANIFETIRNKLYILDVSLPAKIIILLTLALLPLLWIPKLSAFTGLISNLVYFLLVLATMAVLPKTICFWIPPSAALFSIFIAYPVWSWRKLEAARRYLDQELDFLQQNLSNMQNLDRLDNQQTFDKFDARIEQVRIASQQLRFLQEHRKETLSFISHDIRAPLARALLLLQEHQHDKFRLESSIAQAFNLAEEFLQISRAEMVDCSTFKELDFAGLVHQAIDDAYEHALKKEIVLDRKIIDGVIWISGSFGLLHRAVLNLLLNAIKFAPENSRVEIQLSYENENAMLIVGNAGKGIAKKDQPHLFKRFSRIETFEKNHIKEGVGLGLYFVHTVATQHAGIIEVESDIDQMTYFKITLPILNVHLHEA